MAEEYGTRCHPPLKAPAIEIVDLLSEDDSVGKALEVPSTKENRDALGENNDSEGDSQWEDSQWSLYEDALEGKDDDGPLHGSNHS